NKIFNHKIIAALAVIFIAIEAVPVIGTKPNPVIFIKVALWIFGAIFVLLDKNWAAIYLASLASAYFIIDIILPIPQLVSILQSLPPELTTHNKYIPYLIILSMLIEIVFLFCFIYYGFSIFQKMLKAK
ncbi:MAG: hypothetical protein MUP22_07125, partial [Desulfobacterales bacterium]|nr:hypothetical protein [Desulfobacterales bacterium]